MSNKIDRRKQYTKMVLKDGLIQLLKEKPISSVTVKELCELADVNRSTFYSHYKDPYDLLDKMGEEIVVDMTATLNSYNFKKEEEVLQMTEKILEYVATKSEICQVLLSEHGETAFKRRVMKLTQQIIMEKWLDDYHLRGKLSDYIPLLILSGSIEVIKNWLGNGRQESTAEMASLIHHFTNYGLTGFRS
ncbi:TetR/AcrR family transcriptional regulator [Alkalicoccobacillus porphyridii]|uniref:TetR/AcrR family transcriptional regulator n=1 Tax=Alkalicoccobacillus porphyridii TaxID=2597270 RepID=A0A554A122_9BACI|nr:TetR-like C-terminal domain-containing protein [Alkalicoccobacillus porphyridii]TSB47391.1 TetR/AcrR family transcriptional regulator [Alkalicoccobacillus porphyridii]